MMLLMSNPAANPGPSPAGRKLLPDWFDLPVLAGLLVLPLVVILGATIYLSLPRGGEGDMSAAALQPAPIDGDRAFGYLKQICALGPRTAGSEANDKQRQMVAAHFQKLGGQVREQPFEGSDPETGQKLRMTNLIGSWHPERNDRVLIAAHYDTRPHPDQETDPVRYRLPFLGANDCASGVALLMEIAHHLDALPTTLGVDLVLLDGEELVYGHDGEYFLGSKAFARAYARDRRAGKIRYHYRAGLLLDMVGGRDLALKREPYSVKLAARVVDEVWSVAARLKEPAFQRGYGREVMDDHLALNDGGIPTVDLIDFDYPHWHLASDLPENCSGESLARVGRVITAWLALPRR
jgi:hypothetical protein